MLKKATPATYAALVIALGASWVVLGGQSRQAPAPQLDLRGYRLTFNEPFDRLDVSAWGPATQWIAHTPWNGDFGDARFIDPSPQGPFSLTNGMLSITMKQVDGKWVSGLLASNDKTGRGFSQATGYWEMRAKLPDGGGVWPAFWLGSVGKAHEPLPEIDAMEFYGHNPGGYMATVHVWQDGKQLYQKAEQVQVQPGSLSKGFHLYGVKVEKDGVSIYLDRRLVAQFPPRDEYLHPKAILLNLGAGGGWPITGMRNPSVMQVDYVRAYQRAP